MTKKDPRPDKATHSRRPLYDPLPHLKVFLTPWNDAFDILLHQGGRTHQAHVSRERENAYCKLIKSTRQGAILCAKCDFGHSREAGHERQPVTYLCHAGVACIAAPLIVEKEHVASIFLGQYLPADPVKKKESQRRAKKIATTINLPTKELLEARSGLGEIKDKELNELKSNLAFSLRRLANLENERHKVFRAKAQLLQENKLMSSVVTKLGEVKHLRDFWSSVSQILGEVCTVVGASSATLFTCNEQSNVMMLRSSSGLGKERIRRRYSKHDRFFSLCRNSDTPFIHKFPKRTSYTFFRSIAQRAPEPLDKIAAVPFRLREPGEQAVILFFLNTRGDERDSLPIEQELGIISQIAPQITTTFQNCLYIETQRLEKDKARELEKIAEASLP